MRELDSNELTLQRDAMYQEKRIRLKPASFVIKLKHQTSGNSAREMLMATVFQEEKNRIIGCPIIGVPVR